MGTPIHTKLYRICHTPLRLSSNHRNVFKARTFWGPAKSVGSYRALSPLGVGMAWLTLSDQISCHWASDQSAKKWSSYVWKPRRQQSHWKHSNCVGILGMAVPDSNESLGSVTNPTMFFPYFHLWLQKIFFRVYYIIGSSEVFILSWP